ncbi:MAG: hypothetical protein HC888_07415 [Candidatus Competibacteraceae bacterium]|nr:hypothetical protein [Candidatus Competibacteraceae bacterium]
MTLSNESLNLWGEDGVPQELKEKAKTTQRKSAKPTPNVPIAPPKSLRATKLSQRQAQPPSPAAPAARLAQPAYECIGVDMFLIRTVCACGQVYLSPASGDNTGARLIARHSPRTPGEVITGAQRPLRAISMPGHPASARLLSAGHAATARILNTTCSICPECVSLSSEEPYSAQLTLPFESWETTPPDPNGQKTNPLTPEHNND